MKFKKMLSDCFKSRKFISWFAVCLALIIVISSALSIMLSSYCDWKEYYDNAIAERNHQKYLQSLKLECTGITAELNDNVIYYANGKAMPKADDFTVIAHYTEQGEAFDKVLSSDSFTVGAVNDFALNGGDITIRYTFVPQAGETATNRTEEFTATVPYELKKVVPVSIVRNGTPYRVLYADNMSFDGNGLSATVTFNDGSTEVVKNNEFNYGKETLTAGMTNIGVVWSRGGTELPFDCPVKVVSASTYDDGKIVSITPESAIYVDAGAQISSLKPTIRATYESGNRLIIDKNSYIVSGNIQYAQLTKTCLLTISLASDSSVFTRIPAIVKSGIKAKDATVTGGETAEVQESFIVNGEYVTSQDAITVVAPKRNSSISFNIRSDVLSRPDMTLRIALKPTAADASSEEQPAAPTEQASVATANGVNISDTIIMTVNGQMVKLPTDIMLMREAGDKYIFEEIVFPAPILQSRVNTIRFLFCGEGADKIVIDGINLETTYKGKFYTSTESYLLSLSESGSAAAEFSSYAFKDWKENGYIGTNPTYRGFYPHGICTDGQFLYVLATKTGSAPVDGSVTKYDLSTGSVVATTNLLGKVLNEKSAGLCYYDNKIIAMRDDGSQVYIDTAEFAIGAVMSEYNGFDAIKSKLDAGEKIIDVYYNTAKLKFAVLTDKGKIYLFDKGMAPLKSFALKGSSSFYRLTSSTDYIYVNYCKNGGYQPKLAVYDWDENSAYENNYIGMRTVAVSAADLSAAGIVNFGSVNTHGIAVVNGDFYVSIVKKGTDNGAGGAIWKMTMPETSTELLPELTFSEFIDECVNNNIKPNFIAEPTVTGVDAIGTIGGTAGYGRGGVSDGKYLYIANGRSGNKGFVVTKVDPETYAAVCVSMTTMVNEAVAAGDNSRLFIKDEVLYVVAGDVYSIPLDQFRANCVIEKDSKMTALLSLNGGMTVKSAYWNEAWRRYVVLDNGTRYYGGDVYILDEKGSVIKMFTISRSGRKVSAVTGDDEYFYILYTADNVSLEFDVFRYDGSKALSLVVPDVSLGSGVSFNLQAMYIHNGEMRLSVCSWIGGYQGFHEWKLRCNTSMFNIKPSFGQSISDSLSKGTTPTFYGMPSIGDTGLLTGSKEAIARGGAYDGKYLYVTTGNAIEKVDISAYSVEAVSKSFAMSGDMGRLFIKDGVLYCVGGDVFSVELAKFANNCTLAKNDDMKKLLSQNNDANKLISAYYNSTSQKYVVLYADGSVHLLDGNGTELSSSTRSAVTGYTASSVCGDERYYYVSYRKNYQNVIPIDVYSWDGTYVTTVSVTGISSGIKKPDGSDDSSYNIQSIYIADGKLHACMAYWGSSDVKGFRDWTIEFDTASG